MQQVRTTLPTGSIVGERYQVESLLGKGGGGAVYLVRDLRVRQNVFALKEIVEQDQRQRRHFTLEAELLKRTDHPSLPHVYRIFDNPEQGRASMLMDYIEGPNLEKFCRQQPGHRLPLFEALALLAPIVDALTYLHTSQPPIIHRDVKPSNIIVPDSGEGAVLVDFGIAKEFEQEGTTTVIRHATPGYGAPEQYGTGTDMRTDIYGLGATLYTLLTGTVPVDAFFRMTQQMSKRSDPLLPVREVIPAIPETISAAISRAMALDKNERFLTVNDFWQSLQSENPQVPAAGSDAILPVAAPSYNVRPVVLPGPGRGTGISTSARWGIVVLLLLLVLGAVSVSALLLLPRLRGQQARVPTATAKLLPTSTPVVTPTQLPTLTPTSRPTAAPTVAPPALSSAYAGTIHDNNGDIDTSMSLSNVSQDGQKIQGTFRVAQPLSGNGPFTGTIDASSSVRFTIRSSDSGASAPLFFFGQLHSDGQMSGQYCSLDSSGNCNHSVGGYGTWSVQSSSASS